MRDDGFDDDERDRLLRSLNQRLERYLLDDDGSGVVGDDAVAEAVALLRGTRNSPFDLTVQMMVARLHWARAQIAVRSGRDMPESELRTAIAHFSAVYEEHARHIPDEARDCLDRIQEMKDEASDLIDRSSGPEGVRALDEAIEIIRHVVSLLGEEDPTLPVPLGELATALNSRHMMTGRSADIAEAIEVIDRAIAASDPRDEETPRRRHLRKWMLVTRYDDARDIVNLNEAIDVGHELLRVAPDDDPDVASATLDLAPLYWRRYQRTQAIADLDAGIRHGRDGLRLLSGPAGSPRHASSIDDLAILLRSRGKRTGSTNDLTEAVRLSRVAVGAFPHEHFDWMLMCSRLSETLRTAGRESRDAGMLREAVTTADDVLRLAAERGHPGEAGFRQNAGLCRLELAEVTPDITLLNRAVDLLRAAVTGLAGGPHERDARADLANGLAALATASDDPRLLDESIAQHRTSVGDVGDDPATAQQRCNLAVALRTRAQRTHDDGDRGEAAGLFRSIAGLETISTSLRLTGARSWGMLEAEAGHWAAADSALGLAVGLLTQVSAPNLARRDQERQVSGEPGLVAEAVAAAIENGDADRAAELFEQGRGVLTAHALDLRTDVGVLDAEAPELAERFLRLRDALDSEIADPDDRHLWAHQWHELLSTIRARPGFTTFLRPTSAAQIRTASVPGPIVMVNVAARRADALVVRPDGIQVVRLPFTRASMERNAATFVTALEMWAARLQTDRTERQIDDVLRWSWSAVAGPVLKHLGFDERPEPGQRPRLWWMPSTLLNFLPLHAAHTEDATGHRSVLDLAVCSYTPTVRSLVRARSAPDTEGDGAPPLAVAMGRTPGHADLPGAWREAKVLRETFPGATCLVDEEATPDEVQQQLGAHTWVHISCHGHSDRTDPSASFLLLAGAEPLSLLDIARQRIDGEFAFLSACSTAAAGLALSDESVHLAGAFQLAGYRHVVATMWPVLDHVAEGVARHVYGLLMPGTTTVRHSAAIVHDAVQRVRARHPARPTLWAGFVHIGP